MLWTSAGDEDSEREQYGPTISSALREHGTVLIPSKLWRQWGLRFDFPPADVLPATRRFHLHAAWSAAAPASGTLDRIEFIPEQGAKTRAEHARERVTAIASWLEGERDAPLLETLVPQHRVGAQIDQLNVNVTSGSEAELREWRPYGVIGTHLSPAFGDWVLDPAPLPDTPTP